MSEPLILKIKTNGRGLYNISSQVREGLLGTHNGKSGLLNLFIQHTSASLTIQENADPTAKQDLEEFMDRLVPDNQNWHQHTAEGPDDSSSHMKSVLTSTSLNIPIHNGKLLLGTWQALYLWEHRLSPYTRNIILTFIEC